MSPSDKNSPRAGGRRSRRSRTAEAEPVDQGRQPVGLRAARHGDDSARRHRALFDKEFSELMATADVPGFRAGRAPRKLVETRFRKDVADQVKGSLLMDSLTQVTEDAEAVGDQRAGFRSRGGRAARRRADDVRVRHRGAARVRAAQVEGAEDREAGARVQRRRRRQDAARAFWPAAAGWCRSTGRPRRATTSPPT